MRTKACAMEASSDPAFARFKNADFANAKLVAKTPHLRKLQAQPSGKSRVMFRLDSDGFPKASDALDHVAVRSARRRAAA